MNEVEQLICRARELLETFATVSPSAYTMHAWILWFLREVMEVLEQMTDSMENGQQETKFLDLTGRVIRVGDWIMTHNKTAGTWVGKVRLVYGIPTIDVWTAKQIENPEGWKYDHDYVDSRGFIATFGEAEFGETVNPHSLAVIKCLPSWCYSADIHSGDAMSDIINAVRQMSGMGYSESLKYLPIGAVVVPPVEE